MKPLAEPLETPSVEVTPRKKRSRPKLPDEERLIPFSINLPGDTIEAIKADSNLNYPMTPGQIARRVLVHHYKKLRRVSS